jgi:NAD(P)-dependent dehydrogenase (short-subunit alcohol dehydrogenase family)/acyl carrier protein
LSQENPGLITSHIDITLKESVHIDALAAALAAELLVREKGKIVGYRNGRRWVQTIERLSIDGDKKSGSRICTGGLYVVTGGLGKLGYELSRYLLDVYKARVVLLGRKGLPLDAERAGRLGGLERMGDVMYLGCDISDADALRQVVEKIEGQWGRINGVIHAAAVTSGRSINGMTPVQELTVADYMLQFGPKIEGLEALKEVLGDRELDFCLLTSSLSAILGGLGFGAYASANVYMDAYIQGHRDRGQLVNWVSINFDGLHFSDGTDLHNLNNTDIRKVVETVLSITDHPQVIVSKGDLHRRLREWVSREEESGDIPGNEAGTGDKGFGDGGLGDKVVGDGDFSGTATERKLLGLWKDFFGRETIGPDSDFFEIGGDSLKALSIIGRMNKALHIQLPVTEFFKRSTIRKLGEYITATEPVPETKALPEEKDEEMELPSVIDDGANEIQHLLLQNPKLRDVLVFTHDYKHKGVFRLAFVVPDGIISTRNLKSYLANLLPVENLPDYIIKVDSLFAGNRKLLARLAYTGTIGADLYVEPKTDLDKQVSILWREVTGAPRVSLNDTFFDIGGTIGQLEALSKLTSRKFSVELPQSLYYTLSLQQVTARLSKAVKPAFANV